MSAETSPVNSGANPAPNGKHRVKSVSRSSLLLRMLAAKPMRPVDLSRELQLPWATIYRTVRGLSEEGMLQRDPGTGEYSIGPVMYALATTYIRDHPVLGVGLSHLEHALGRVQGLLKVTERCGFEAITLFAEQNPRVPAIRRIREQYRIPLHFVSFGQVLLAYDDSGFRETYLEQPLQRLSERTITDPDQLKNRLSEIRDRGFAYSRAELQANNASISVPVVDRDGAVIAALSAIVPLEVYDDETSAVQHRGLLQDTAATISEALGWRPYDETSFATAGLYHPGAIPDGTP